MSRMTMADYARLGESLGNAYGTYQERGLRSRTPEEVQQFTPEQLAAYEQNYASTGDVGQMTPQGLTYQSNIATSAAPERAYVPQQETITPQTQYRLGGLTQTKPFSPDEARAQNEADIREQWKSQGTYGEDRMKNYDETQLRGLQNENLKHELGKKKEEQTVLKAMKTKDSFLKYLNDQYPDDNAYVMHTSADGFTHIIQDNADGKPTSVGKFKDWETDGMQLGMQYAPDLAAKSWGMKQEQKYKLEQIKETGLQAQKTAGVRVSASKAAMAALRPIGVTKTTGDPVYSDKNGAFTYELDADGNQVRTPYTNEVVKMGLGKSDFPSFKDWAPTQDNPTVAGWKKEKQAYETPAMPAKSLPAVGEVRDGHKYIGGNPGNPASWQLVTPIQTPEGLRKQEFDRISIAGQARRIAAPGGLMMGQ